MGAQHSFAVAIVGTILAAASPVSAAVVAVSASSGPWSTAVAGNPPFGVGDNSGPTSVAVNAGDSITIAYSSGLTSAFGGVPTVDALGYVGSIFGSGFGFTGLGTSGTFFPSHAIDPLNVGSPIYLNALIGDFVDASGLVLGVFAPGNGPATYVAPVGAVALLLGINDDIFRDNTGALEISVTGSSVGVNVAEPGMLALLGLGVFGLTRRSRRLRQGS